MSENVDTVVIGAGVVGLAVGRALALDGRDVVVVEKNARIGEETSARNSEVIHAGIYYPTGSLKARLCVRGKAMLYAYCAEKGIGVGGCGKLVVAVDDGQLERLRALERQGRSNGVHDLAWLDGSALAEIEPEVSGAAALLSPSTGIIDVHAFMLALEGDIERAGGMVVTQAELERGTLEPDGIRLDIASGASTSELKARAVVNAGGLHAATVAQRLAAGAEVPTIRYAKGNYFAYRGANPFRHLIYPLPVAGGLGVHATLDLAGKLRFGPDVEWIDAIDYGVDTTRAEAFYESIRRYWPGVVRAALEPSYAGVRPKLGGPGEPPQDFRITRAATTGRAALVHLLGIESPGLTASLAIGEHVTGLLS